MGAGSHTLTFAASNSETWTSGNPITITGWAGSWDGTGGTAGKIFFGNSSAGLTASQLNQILFYNGSMYYTATILSTGEVVPIAPKPNSMRVNGSTKVVLSGTANVILQGNINNAGTIKTNASHDEFFVFKGTTLHEITGDGANYSFENLKIDNTAGVQLSTSVNPITVRGILDLANGPLILNGKKIIINNTATSAITRSSGYILSESEDSKVQWNILDPGTYSFPFGTTDGEYIPFIADVSSAGTNLTVSTWHTDNSNHPYPTEVTNMNNSENQENSAKCADRFWLPVYDGSYTANFTFNYDASGTIDDLNSLTEGKFVAQYWSSSNGGHWEPAIYGSQAAHNVNSVPGQSAPWVLVDRDFPLPIELLNFSASCKDNIVIINWSTSSETNNDYFTLERSIDAQDWVIIATIDGAGNSNTLMNYSYTDTNSFNSNVYYRLKQTDLDGKFTYSEVVHTGCNNPLFEDIQVFPNPAYDYLTSNILSNENVTINISIIDVMGQSVISDKFDMIKGKNSFLIDVSKLAPATYYFKIETLDGLFKGDKLILIR